MSSEQTRSTGCAVSMGVIGYFCMGTLEGILSGFRLSNFLLNAGIICVLIAVFLGNRNTLKAARENAPLTCRWKLGMVLAFAAGAVIWLLLHVLMRG